MKTEEESLREQLAELEHEQWEYWTKNIINNEKISEDRLDKWAGLWKPYKKLTEEQKDKDRIWADKVLVLLNEKVRKLKEELENTDEYSDASYIVDKIFREKLT